MPTYRVKPDLKATFISAEYNLRGNPGDLIEVEYFLPDYLPLELVDKNNPPAITDSSTDYTLSPNQEVIINLHKLHKRIQISLLNISDDLCYIYLDDEENAHVVLSKELPDYAKEFIYYHIMKIRIKAPQTNTSDIKIRVHLEAK